MAGLKSTVNILNPEDRESTLALQYYDSQRHVKDLMDSVEFKEEDKKGIDLPFFDFESILAATDSFSEANKLGKGGFGPVYKVTLILLETSFKVTTTIIVFITVYPG